MDSSERYEVLKVLQENETGRVSLVWHKELKCRRILKEMSLFHEGRDALRSEIQILQKVKAPFFPTIIDSYETEDSVCMVEEYVEGEDLGVYFQRVRKISPDELVRFSMELCEIVAFLHEPQNKVLHLDIKPGNIVISDNRMKLVDFGSAICRGDEKDLRSGTPRFAAPELLYNGALSEGSDIWSMGKTFEFMRMYAENIPKGYDRIVSRCLRKGHGYKSASEISADLGKISPKKAIPSGDNLMAIIGIADDCRGSVFAVKLARALAHEKKTILLDCNPLCNLEQLEEACLPGRQTPGYSFIHKGVLIGKRVESPDVRGWRGRGFDSIICDLGSDFTAVGDLPYRKVFLVGSLTPWTLENWKKAIGYLENKAEIYAVITDSYGNIRLPGLSHSHIIDLRKRSAMRHVTRCI